MMDDELHSDSMLFKQHKDDNNGKSNPWLLLKTITSFETAPEFGDEKHAHQESFNKSQEASSSSHSSSKTSPSKLVKMGKTEASHHVEEVLEVKNSVSLGGENRVSLPLSESILTQKGNIHTPSHPGVGRTRSHKTSLSESDIFSTNPGSTSADKSTNYNRNVTVSAAGDVAKVSHSRKSLESLSHFSPTSFLVESLIDQICKLMEKDKTRQKKLYHVVCDRLHRMQLIDDTHAIEEFQFMRTHYQRALNQFLEVAKLSTYSSDGTIMLPVASSNVAVDLKLNSEQVLEWSRYYHDFQELEYIAKGGFGQVYRVRNKLDGGEYAIKKIFLRYCYLEGFFRSLKEVKMLARLNHPNIVSYKAAWLEPLNKHTQKSKAQRKSQHAFNNDASASLFSHNSRLPLPLPPTSNFLQGDSSDIVFQDTSPDTDSHHSDEKRKNKQDLHSESSMCQIKEKVNTSKMSKKELSDLLNKNSILFQPSTSAFNIQEYTTNSESHDSDLSDNLSEAIFAFSKSREDGSWSDKASRQPIVLRNWATLYVQMQLCELTLRQWLEERNSSLPAYPLGANTKEGSVAFSLFRKIVRGVEYIHSQGIVHHDIKPSNIFVDKTLKEVQVGDFGLSCSLLSRVDRTGAVGDSHGGVGTRIYAAPEQLRGKCTPKSDIYSLGILLLELLQPFHTDMERSKTIEKLRGGHLPSELTTAWPHVARLMSDMLASSAAMRPTASEVIKRVEILLKVNMESDVSSQLAAKDETIRLLKEAVASRDQEIAELRRRLCDLDN